MMSIVTKHRDIILYADKLVINLIIGIMNFAHNKNDESFRMMGLIISIKHGLLFETAALLTLFSATCSCFVVNRY